MITSEEGNQSTGKQMETDILEAPHQGRLEQGYG